MRQERDPREPFGYEPTPADWAELEEWLIALDERLDAEHGWEPISDDGYADGGEPYTEEELAAILRRDHKRPRNTRRRAS